MANRVKVQVLGNSYYLTTDRPEGQIREIERDLSEQLATLREAKPNLSTVDSLIVLLLNAMDEISAGEQSMDRMREQLTQYLEDAAKLRGELEEQTREVVRLTAELEKARNAFGQLGL